MIVDKMAKRLTIVKLIVCLMLVSFSSGCKKDKTVGPDNAKPEWRVTEIFVKTRDIKFHYGWDTTRFFYDARGRFQRVYNSYHIINGAPNPIPDYKYHFNYHYEYGDTTEQIRNIKIYEGSTALPNTVSLTYNADGNLQQYRFTSRNGSWQQYDLQYPGGGQPSKMRLLTADATLPDTTETAFTWSGNDLTKKVDSRHNGVNYNAFTFSYNAAGNPVFNLVTGTWVGISVDTMRKISFTWKPGITPNTNKLKRLNKSFEYLRDGWPNFFFPSYSKLIEFDIFDLTSNNEVLESYHFTMNKWTNMIPQMVFSYELDADGNVGKVLGTFPGKSSTMEMTVKYERIQ